jgi:hypothetical protein
VPATFQEFRNSEC